NNYAAALFNFGDLEESLEHFQRAWQVTERITDLPGAGHREVVQRSNLGEVLRLLGRLDEAEHHLQRARAVMAAADGPVVVHGPPVNLAGLALAGGRAEDAARLASEALEGALAVADRTTACDAQLALGRARLALGEVAGAREVFQQCLVAARGASL